MREMQTETTMGHHPHLLEWLACETDHSMGDEDAEGLEPPFTAGGNGKPYYRSGKQLVS